MIMVFILPRMVTPVRPKMDAKIRFASNFIEPVKRPVDRGQLKIAVRFCVTVYGATQHVCPTFLVRVAVSELFQTVSMPGIFKKQSGA